MAETLRRIDVGALPLSIVSEGWLRYPVDSWPDSSPAAWTGIDTPDERGRVRLGLNVVYVHAPEGGILLDAGLACKSRGRHQSPRVSPSRPIPPT